MLCCSIFCQIYNGERKKLKYIIIIITIQNALPYLDAVHLKAFNSKTFNCRSQTIKSRTWSKFLNLSVH